MLQDLSWLGRSLAVLTTRNTWSQFSLYTLIRSEKCGWWIDHWSSWFLFQENQSMCLDHQHDSEMIRESLVSSVLQAQVILNAEVIFYKEKINLESDLIILFHCIILYFMIIMTFVVDVVYFFSLSIRHPSNALVMKGFFCTWTSEQIQNTKFSLIRRKQLYC